jgi:hypothetical protein
MQWEDFHTLYGEWYGILLMSSSLFFFNENMQRKPKLVFVFFYWNFHQTQPLGTNFSSSLEVNGKWHENHGVK